MNKIITSSIIIIVIVSFLKPATSVYPATTTKITVNSIQDVINSGDQQCTLREAIIAANRNLPSGNVKGECAAGSFSIPDSITIPPGTYTLTNAGQNENDSQQGDLDIKSGMTIQGAGLNETIIQAGTGPSLDDSVDRVLHVNTSSSVNFEGLTIRYGKPDSPSGGGMLIENTGTISINNCMITDNKLDTTFLGAGAGIAHLGDGTLSIANSAFEGNIISGSDFTYGGGIYNSSGILNVANTTMIYNHTADSGGALYNLGTAYLSNVTLTHNYADLDNNTIGDGGGIAGTGTTYLKNSILDNQDKSSLGEYPNIHGSVISSDFNIIADIGYESGFIPADHDIVGDSNRIDPLLGDYVGSFASHQLASRSLVLDQIPAASCTYQSGGSNPLFSDGEAIIHDQRGAPRPNDSHCDIGAREFFTLSVSSTEDSLEDDGQCSLREAISNVNTGKPSGETNGECDLPPDQVDLPAGTYTLEIEGTGENNNLTGDLDIRNSVILAGAGADSTIIQADPQPGTGIDRVIDVSSFLELEIWDVTIRYGKTANPGAGLNCIESTVTLSGVSITDNIAVHRGGGINCSEFCDFFITGSSITGNQTQTIFGGGIYAFDSTLAIANSTIAENQATLSGGGIYGSGYLYLSNVTITSNVADNNEDGLGDGGGVNFSGVWNVKSSIIAENIDRGGENPDLAGTTGFDTSLDYNLIGDIGTQEIALEVHDIVGTSAFPEDPKLGGLTGTPAYQMPEPGSQVIDAIPPIRCTYTSPEGNPLFSDGDPVTSDQAGGTRPVDGDEDGHFACDIGAVEYTPPENALVYLPLVMNE